MNNFSYRAGSALDCPGAGHVADGAKPYAKTFDLFPREWLEIGRGGKQDALPSDDFAIVAKINGGQRNFLLSNVVPDIELSPIG